MVQRESTQGSGGANQKRTHVESDLESLPPAAKSEGGRSGGRGKVIPRYHDRVEDYAYVTESDLRETVEFGALQTALIQTGTFFFSGAFWLLIEQIVRQSEATSQFKFTPWMAMCVLSMIFGIALAVAGWRLFLLKQDKIKRYFPSPGDKSPAT